jgi:hypothetical protein
MTALTRERRDALLARMEEIKDRMYGPGDGPLATEVLRALNREGEEVKAEYLAGLAAVAVARCPHCAEIAYLAMDVFGLDGPWWDVHGAAGEATACIHHLATLGALDVGAAALAGAAPRPIDDIRPGPAVPFVVPRLMAIPGMVCVLYATRRVAAGSTAYLMSYFADPPAAGADGHPTWLRTQYGYRDGDGNTLWSTRADRWDFDLAPWLESDPPGLAWIAMDDDALSVKTGAAECPYLGLPGRHHPVSIRQGQIHDLPMPDGGPVAAGDLFD